VSVIFVQTLESQIRGAAMRRKHAGMWSRLQWMFGAVYQGQGVWKLPNM